MNVLLLSLTPQDPTRDHFWRNRQTLAGLAVLGHNVDWIAPSLPLHFPLPAGVTHHPLPRAFRTPFGIGLFAAAHLSRREPDLIHAVDAAFPCFPFSFQHIPLLADVSTLLPARLDKADAIITHSSRLLQRLRDRPSLARTALLTPLPFADAVPLPTATQHARVNHLGDQPGILLAAPAAAPALLLDALPDFDTLPSPWRLLLFTQTKKEHAATRNLLKKNPHAASIKLLPPLSPDEAQPLFAACDLLLLPDPEPADPVPFLLDFAFSGTPILATDTAAHRHPLPPNGVTFFAPTSRALVTALKRLLAHYDTALQRAARAADHLALHHTPAHRADELRLACAYAQQHFDA